MQKGVSAQQQPLSGRLYGKAALLLVLLGCAWVFVHAVVLGEPRTGDDAYMATEAWNMLTSPSFVVRNANVPGGSPDWVQDDLRVIGHPPLHALLLAAGMGVSGGRVWGLGLAPFVGFLVTLACLYGIVARFHRDAAPWATALFAISPVILRNFISLDMDPGIVPFGMLAVWLVLKGEQSRAKRYHLLGGLSLGVGFLVKLWLIAPFVTAIGTVVLIALYRDRVKAIGRLAVLAAGFLLGASSHLLLVAVSSPQDIPFWLRYVYFGIFTGEGGLATKWSGGGAYAGWEHPFWYYGAVMARDHFFLLLLFFLGLPVLIRRLRKGEGAGLVAVCLGGLLAVLPISLFRTKEPLYILPDLPFVYMLGGLSFAFWLHDVRERALSTLERTWSWLVLAGGLLASAALLAGYATGRVNDNDLTLPFVATFVGAALVIAGAGATILLRASGNPLAIMAPLALVLLIGATLNEYSAHLPPYRTISTLMVNAVRDQKPQEVSFVAARCPHLQFWLNRRGHAWDQCLATDDPQADIERAVQEGVRVFVLETETLANEKVQSVLPWLTQHARDLSGEVYPEDGREYRVYVVERPAESAAEGRTYPMPILGDGPRDIKPTT